MFEISIISLTLLFFSEVNAHAYIDPGLGSIIIQALVGALAAATTFIYYCRNIIKNFFKRFKKKDNREDKKENN